LWPLIEGKSFKSWLPFFIIPGYFIICLNWDQFQLFWARISCAFCSCFFNSYSFTPYLWLGAKLLLLLQLCKGVTIVLHQVIDMLFIYSLMMKIYDLENYVKGRNTHFKWLWNINKIVIVFTMLIQRILHEWSFNKEFIRQVFLTMLLFINFSKWMY